MVQKLQVELSQHTERVASLQRELDVTREEKNQTEQRISDKLNDLETMKREFDEVKNSCEVMYFLNYWLHFLMRVL